MLVRKHFIAIALGLALPYATYADDAHHKKIDAKSATGAALTPGEVKKVDKDTGKVTIKHGPLENLGMPAMTMVFQVKDPGMLDQVKAGDKINFVADKINGAYTVMKVEPAK